MFAELLRHHLQRTHPQDIAELNLKASQWYEENGLLADALNHALAAGHIEHVIQLTEALAVFEMDQNDLQDLKSWLESLPLETIHKYPWLQVTWAWVCFNRGDYEGVRHTWMKLKTC